MQIKQPVYEAINLFANLFEDDNPKQPEAETLLMKYGPVKLAEVYKELVEAFGE